jgi:quercetin dioxygenase-like cupin family protein
MKDSATYFSLNPAEQKSSAGGAWVDLNVDFPPLEMGPGLLMSPIFSEQMTLNVVRLAPHTVAPVHAHPEEQIALVVEGEMEFEVNGEVRRLKPFMAAVIPSNALHGARTHDQGCVAIDAFHPPRQALLEAMKARESR